PHLLEEDLAGEHLAGVPRQADQEIELAWGERDRRTAPGDGVAGDVDGEVADLQALRAGHLEAAYASADARDQLPGLERLGDVVVGPGLEADNHVEGVAACREHHDGNAGL